MSLSESRMAYEDCYKAMDRALDTENGVRIGYDTKEEAMYFRARMNNARKLDRRLNGERFSPDHPLYRRSEYDALTFRLIEGDMWWIYAERRSAVKGVLEEITEEPSRDIPTYRRL